MFIVSPFIRILRKKKWRISETDVPLGIFVTKENSAERESPTDVSIIVEGVEVLSGVSDMATACSLLFGVIYAMNLSYPKELKYIFEVIQKVFMELDSNRFSPKV